MKHFLSIFAVAVMTVVAWGCSGGSEEEIPLAISPGALSFSADKSGRPQTVQITTSRDWEAVPSQDWVIVAREDKTLKVSVDKNWTDKARTAQVVITSGSQTAILGITQKAGTGKFDGFTVSTTMLSDLSPTIGDDVVVSSKEKAYTLEITSGQYSWRAEVVSGSDFVSIPDNDLHKGGYLVFTVKANTSIEERKAVLKIESEYKGALCKYELKITQNSFNRNEDPEINDVIEW